MVNNLASSVFLIFPWINITMKPQVLDKAIFLYQTNIYERYLKIASAVDSWNKIQEQLKNTLLKVYPIITLKQSLVIFISNHINNPLITFIHQEIIMIIKYIYIYIYNQMWVKYKLKYKLCWVGQPARRYGLQKESRNIGPKDSTIWALVLYRKILFGEQLNCSKAFLFNKLIYKSLSHVSTPCIHPSFLISA